MAFVEAGCTTLEVQLGAYLASYETNFKTDRAVAAELRKPTGGTYHPKSVARCRLNLARRELIRSRRVRPGERPSPRAKFLSAHGTTEKWVNWSALGRTCPIPRSERRARSREAARLARQEARAREAMAPLPPVSAPPASERRSVSPGELREPPSSTTRPVADLPPELRAVVGSIEQLRAQREGGTAAPPKPPPD